jgi:chromosome segregation ATPase
MRLREILEELLRVERLLETVEAGGEKANDRPETRQALREARWCLGRARQALLHRLEALSAELEGLLAEVRALAAEAQALRAQTQARLLEPQAPSEGGRRLTADTLPEAAWRRLWTSG